MSEQKRVIALGFFDGVHIGHAALMNKTNERAEEYGLQPSVLTFDVHPDTLVFQRSVPLINSASERESYIKRRFGIENVFFIHFSKKLMCMDWKEFIESLIDELNIGWIVVGHDFNFGYKGLGTAEKLKAYCADREIGCDIIPAVTYDGMIVSSTLIRELISNGNIEIANGLLGHPHFIEDTVHAGYRLGTEMGTPTINMTFQSGIIIPAYGVYASKVYLDDSRVYKAVTNIGIRPTVNDTMQPNIETHLMDYSGNLYGRPARVELHKFLRKEMKFSSVDELSEHIKNDIQSAEKYFSLN